MYDVDMIDTIIHIGLKEGRFKTERSKVSKIEDAANRSLTLDNGHGKHGRTLDLVACNAQDFNHWVCSTHIITSCAPILGSLMLP
jgi:hypothetical protein